MGIRTLFCCSCSTGFYASEMGLESCEACPAGKYCENDGTILPLPCPQGFYCHKGDANGGEKQACPSGTYGAREGLKDLSECSKCLTGHFCEESALKNVSGLCNAGYYCRLGASLPTPALDVGHNPPWFGPCPTGGYYCEEGASDPLPCPSGRYAPDNKFKILSANDCNKCKAGDFCAQGNQTETSGPCDVGYFCLAGSPTAAPNASHGGLCPAGFRCPVGSAWPEACEPGTYNNVSGQGTCKDCPRGFYCTGNTTSPEECPVGHYCPLKTISAFAFACKAGTFNNRTGRSDVSACQACTPGYYCVRSGTSIIMLLFCTSFLNAVNTNFHLINTSAN